MSNPRYVPRSFSLDPTNFGNRAHGSWKDPDKYVGAELDQLLASQFQHRIAVEITTRIGSRFESLGDFADFAGINYARLGRMLNGVIVMRIEDLMNAQRNLNVPGSFFGVATES